MPGDSNVSDGIAGTGNRVAVPQNRRGTRPVHPMDQFLAPGGCWIYPFVRLEVPRDGPPHAPAVARSRVLRVSTRVQTTLDAAGISLLSTSSPVAQRWCGATPALNRS